jgi:hypothetical protein
VRWERLFDDLEAQLTAAEAAEFEAEVAERTRHEVAQVRLNDRLGAAVGRGVELALAPGGTLAVEVRRVGDGWLLGGLPSGGEVVVSTAALIAVRGLPVAADPASRGTDGRLGLGYVLRAVARDRGAVTIVCRDGSRRTGTVDRVGADFLDLAEHPVGEPRRVGVLTGTRTLALAAICLVQPA